MACLLRRACRGIVRNTFDLPFGFLECCRFPGVFGGKETGEIPGIGGGDLVTRGEANEIGHHWFWMEVPSTDGPSGPSS